MAGPHRTAVVGALGRMGERVRAAIADEPALVLAAALEAPGHAGIGQALGDVVVTDDAAAALAACDVVIDFSVPSSTLANLRAAAQTGRVAYVTGTTGCVEAERAEIAQLAKRIPVMHAANFSVAVNLLGWLVRQAAERLGPAYDAEILELHHGAKRDAPSGTALRLAEAVAEGRGTASPLVLERAGLIGERPPGSVGVMTLRGGDNVGEHTVMFVGGGERLELVHRAHTRDHFARGATRAAAWLIGRDPGLYRVEAMLGLDSLVVPARA